MSMLKDDRNSDIEKRYRKHAVFDGRYKAIQSMDGSDTKIYDLDNDPLEQSTLPQTHPGAFKTLRSLHQNYLNRQSDIEKIPLPKQPTALPDDVNESLKHLGYMR